MEFAPQSTMHRRPIIAAALLTLLALAALWPRPVAPAGTRDLYQDGAPGFRASIEWRNSKYGSSLGRRTLLKVYAVANEHILVSSSAVGVPNDPNEDELGDILIYNPGLVTGPVGAEVIPATASFSCNQQRATAGNGARGRIANRAQELAGPNAAGGYLPCYYQAPTTGIYDVVMLGPAGPDSNRERSLSGLVDAPDSDFLATQRTAITAWDITIADSPTGTYANDREGRTFAYYFALFTGGNGRPIYTTAYVTSQDGFTYALSPRGADPYGFLFYVNQYGFLNTNDAPLYRNVMADPRLTTQAQNQLDRLQGGVRIQPPQYPIFLQRPAPETLQALSIPTEAAPPVVSDFTFTGPDGKPQTTPGAGGTFSFTISGGSAGVFVMVLSRDGVTFDPTLPTNRVLIGTTTGAGRISVSWDGRDNAGAIFPPGKGYTAAVVVSGGEVHFPSLDVENNLEGTTIELLNPPGGRCPPWNGGCFGAFYDDRGYRTTDGRLVGVEVNGALCAGNPGNPPNPPFSDPIRGYDSRENVRGWGFTSGGNPDALCDPEGGFGDKKGIDRWTFYPSQRLVVPLDVVDPTAVTLAQLSGSRAEGGVLVRWQTGAELDSRGFHLYRADRPDRTRAVRVTTALIPARGTPAQGAAYSWLDAGVTAGTPASYWLAEVGQDGTTTEYGPLTIAASLTHGPHAAFLPLLGR